MDTITHGIAGALIGKAVFHGEDMFTSKPMNRARIITWTVMFGAIFPGFGHPSRLVFEQSDVDFDVASQLYAFAGLHADFRTSSRRDHALVRTLAQMGCAFFRSFSGPVRHRHSQPHFSRLGHELWHDDLVAATMVASRLGFNLHRRLHIQRASPGSANSRLGLSPSRRLEESRHHYVVRTCTRFASRCGVSEKCRRADF